MNLPQIFNYEGNQVRTAMHNGEPWFIATDVCRVLDYSNPSESLKRLDDDERTLISIEGASNGLPVNAVNEYGLYNLILGSRKPEAKEFKRWITHEVIPSIRKTGSYSVQPKLPQSFAETLRMLAAEIEEKEAVKAENEQLTIQTAEQQRKLKEQEAPVAIYNLAIAAQNTQSMADVAKALGTGRTRLFDFLRDEGIIIKGRATPYQRYIESGYFVVRERPRASGDAVVNDPVTRVTAKGFDYIARLLQKRQGA